MTMPKGWEKLKKDPQESVENKRWSIEQIKYFLDSASDEIGGAETYFLAKLRNHTLSLRNLRTIFLSVISLALAIVLGIREPVNLSMVNFIQILIILLFISAGGMLVIEVIKSRLSVHILNVEYGFKAIPFRINILKGFISNASFDLDRIT